MSTYIVVAGDTLYDIAQAHGISLDALVAANPQLSGSTIIEVGQILNLPGSGSGSPDIDQALSIQNAARQEASTHGNSRGDLSWDPNLASDAQQWANNLAATGNFQHSGFPEEGENLYAGTGDGVNFAAAAQSWCNERQNYNGEPIGQGNFGSYGHYTQVVWPTTSRVGMAIATGSNGWTYIVGRYQAQGNFVGQSAW